jgi:o-succinylbenzoate---CoA ligase
MDPFIRFMSQKEDWVLLNSKMPQAERDRISEIVSKHFLGEHVWLMSSGTESLRGDRIKMVALSKKSLLAAAQGVCDFFEIQKSDVILNLLPYFHVSGLMQKMRAFVSHAQHVLLPALDWDVNTFFEDLNKYDATITSLVPTQIYDIVQEKLSTPSRLRLVFVGGGALEDSLFEKASALGWPLVRTYGMTETCAMIAYRAKDRSTWQRLPHLQKWESTTDNKLLFFGGSLLSGYLLIESDGRANWVDPKINSGYPSDDRGIIQNDELQLLGRESDLVKIKGETVSLVELNSLWIKYSHENQLSTDSVIVALPEPRDGAKLILVSEKELSFEQIAPFQSQLLPFQRIQKIVSPFLIPRSSLGKIKTADLLSRLQLQS